MHAGRELPSFADLIDATIKDAIFIPAMFQDRLQSQLVPALQAAFQQLFSATIDPQQFAFQPGAILLQFVG